MIDLLLLLGMLWTTGASNCEPNSGNCRGNCQGLNVDASADPAAGGNNVAYSIHICDPMTMTCTLAIGSNPASSGNRAEATHSGCTITIAPKQGLTWGDICGCGDLVVHCEG